MLLPCSDAVPGLLVGPPDIAGLDLGVAPATLSRFDGPTCSCCWDWLFAVLGILEAGGPAVAAVTPLTACPALAAVGAAAAVVFGEEPPRNIEDDLFFCAFWLKPNLLTPEIFITSTLICKLGSSDFFCFDGWWIYLKISFWVLDALILRSGCFLPVQKIKVTAKKLETIFCKKNQGSPRKNLRFFLQKPKESVLWKL